MKITNTRLGSDDLVVIATDKGFISVTVYSDGSMSAYADTSDDTFTTATDKRGIYLYEADKD